MTHRVAPSNTPDKPISTTPTFARVIAALCGFIIAFALVLGGAWMYKSTTASAASWPGNVNAEQVTGWLEKTTPSIKASKDDVELLTRTACEEYAKEDRGENSVADAVNKAIADKGIAIDTDASEAERDTIISAMTVTYRCPQYLGREVK